MTVKEKEELRFVQLLQPNKDLAANWAVDVGRELENYLAELSVTSLFEDGTSSLNFAEAALLIQGSIQIYSRKVEYLYALVLQALDFIAQKKQAQQDKSSIQEDGKDADVVEEEGEEEFLNLDDVQEEANIDIDHGAFDDFVGASNNSFMDSDIPVQPGGENYDGSNLVENDGLPYHEKDLDGGASFEDLCRAHLDALLRNIAESEKQTELASRVSTWKQKIEKNLEEQDSRPPFDIHVYGERVLDKLSLSVDDECDNGNEVRKSFTEIVGGQEKHEVARTFAALLQLVNNGNVVLDKGISGGQSFCFTAEKPFFVRLLSSNRRHEEMLKYRAPSMATMSAGKKASKKSRNISYPKILLIFHFQIY